MDEPTAFDPLRVYVVGGGMAYIRMFHNAGYRGAEGVDDADIVCFTGGEDVSPQFYGEQQLRSTYNRLGRDIVEKEVFDAALAKGLPMVGICRGAQFLNVMCGGKLWQDVNNHGVSAGHHVLDLNTNRNVHVSSTHHQMMIPTDKASVLAVAGLATEKHTFTKVVTMPAETAAHQMDDTEVVWYEEQNCLCFQPHPEFDTPQFKECRDYFFELVDDFILAGGDE